MHSTVRTWWVLRPSAASRADISRKFNALVGSAGVRKPTSNDSHAGHASLSAERVHFFELRLSLDSFTHRWFGLYDDSGLLRYEGLLAPLFDFEGLLRFGFFVFGFFAFDCFFFFGMSPLCVSY
jgi:hypothetical protein